MRVEIFWALEDQWFSGTVGSFNKEHNSWEVAYDDGEDIYEEWNPKIWRKI